MTAYFTNSSYYTATTTGLHSNGSTISFSAFVFLDSLANFRTIIDIHDPTTADLVSCYKMDISSTGRARIVVASAGSSDYAETAAGIVVAKRWHHIAAVVRSSTSRTIYVDGVGTTTTTSQGSPTTSALTSVSIGRRGGSSSANYMNGMISFPAIWYGALNDSEISSLAAGLHPVEVRPNNLYGAWNFLDGDLRQQSIGGRIEADLLAVGSVYPVPSINFTYGFSQYDPYGLIATNFTSGQSRNRLLGGVKFSSFQTNGINRW